MRIAAPYNPDLTALDAHMASVRSWFADVLAFLLETLARLDPIARQQQQGYSACQTRYAVHSLRYVLFTRALVSANAACRAHSERFYQHDTHMIRQRAMRRALTNKTLAPCLHGKPEQRLESFKQLLDHPERAIAHTIARARRVLPRLRVLRLVHARPSTTAPRIQLIATPAAHADTS